MTIKYISLEEILRLHFQLIEDFGGSHGVRDEGRLKSVVEAPSQEVFSETQYDSVYEKAAVYFRNIIGIAEIAKWLESHTSNVGAW